MSQTRTQPIHVAITRRIKPGCEAEFQKALTEFFKTSFAHTGVQGAAMLVPPPGSHSNEYGIIRTFASDEERKSFYASPAFLEWKEKVSSLTEGEPAYKELHGLEAFFRNQIAPNPPPMENGRRDLFGSCSRNDFHLPNRGPAFERTKLLCGEPCGQRLRRGLARLGGDASGHSHFETLAH